MLWVTKSGAIWKKSGELLWLEPKGVMGMMTKSCAKHHGINDVMNRSRQRGPGRQISMRYFITLQGLYLERLQSDLTSTGQNIPSVLN